MEAGWSRMNDLTVIQASQVSNSSLSFSESGLHTSYHRAFVLMYHLQSLMPSKGELLLVMIIDTILRDGRLSYPWSF